MRSWSIRLFRVFGIQLAVHATFFLLVGYVAWQGWKAAVTQGEPGIYGALIGCAYLLVFFACVVLHELGHALMARRFGVRVPRILLLPIGGMAEFDSIPRKPSRELLIALAGPAVNFAIVALLLICVSFPDEGLWAVLRYYFASGAEIAMSPLQDLLVMNLVMGCFNLVPVFPMDGGRVLRALLATRLSYLKATFYAATLAKVLAASGALAAIFLLDRPHLALLLVFIFFAGELEYRAVYRREFEDRQWRKVFGREPAERDEPPPLPHAPDALP